MATLQEDRNSTSTFDEKLDTEKQGESLCLHRVTYFPSSSALHPTSAHVVPAVAVAEFDDPNLDKDALALEDDSPYPEVRSAVANTDDPDMPVNTFRAWFIGVLWAVIIPGMNQFFFFRYPSVTVSGVRSSVLTSTLR